MAACDALPSSARPASDRVCSTPRSRRRSAQAELLDGGSLYWVIKGVIQVRQRLVGFEEGTKDDGSRCCLILLDQQLVPVRPVPRRAFQGWRYFDAADAPPDLGSGEQGPRRPAAQDAPRPRRARAAVSPAPMSDLFGRDTSLVPANPEPPPIPMPRPRLTAIVESLPAFVPFVGPEALERARGRPFRARLGANESVFGPRRRPSRRCRRPPRETGCTPIPRATSCAQRSRTSTASASTTW